MSKREDHRAEFARCLNELDVKVARKLWLHVFPGLPVPKTDKDMLATLHLARTTSPLADQMKRYYSHRWLLDNGLISMLPDPLRPVAERVYPTKTPPSVGIALAGSTWFKPAIPLIRGEMEKSVLETMGDDVDDPTVIRSRLLQAGEKEKHKLFGRVLPAPDFAKTNAAAMLLDQAGVKPRI